MLVNWRSGILKVGYSSTGMIIKQEQVTAQMHVGGITYQAVPLHNGKIRGCHCSQVNVTPRHCVSAEGKRKNLKVYWNL